MPIYDALEVDFGHRGGDQRNDFQTNLVFDSNFNSDFHAAMQLKVDKVKASDDMDTVTIFAAPDDPKRDEYNDQAMNRKVPDVYPVLTSEQETFTAAAAGIVQEFATVFPEGAADQALEKLLKHFSGNLPSQSVIDAINIKMRDWYKEHPGEYPVRLGFSSVTGDYYLGIQQGVKYEPLFRLNGQLGERLPQG